MTHGKQRFENFANDAQVCLQNRSQRRKLVPRSRKVSRGRTQGLEGHQGRSTLIVNRLNSHFELSNEPLGFIDGLKVKFPVRRGPGIYIESIDINVPRDVDGRDVINAL